MSLLETPQLIGVSPAVTELREEIARVGVASARVLITGESGTGKEVVAKAIALSASRAGSGPFVPVNCAGISESLLEVELFGQSISNGTVSQLTGRLELAENGTLFLNEIGELSPQMQGRLLRFFETGEIQRVGAERVVKVDNVRVVSATNRDPSKLILDGQLRTDFFYRINVIHLAIPPLRQRAEDIPMLVDHFLKRFRDGAQVGDHQVNGSRRSFESAGTSPVRAIASDAMTALCAYSWPGNVRQLENVVERLVVTGRRELVPFEALPPEIRQASSLVSVPARQLSLTMTDDLFRKLVDDRESFWTAVYPLYMSREITKSQVRDLVRKGLEEARGNYRIVLRLFNMETRDYKRFLSFLRKHDCQLPFKEYR